MNSGILADLRRWINDAGTQNGDEVEEPSVGELWKKASPELDRALIVYAKLNDPSTPASTWNPLGESKVTCQKELDKILDVLLAILGVCGAGEYRQRMKLLHDRIASSRELIGKCQEELLSAPSASSQSFMQGFVTSSRESLQQTIADEKETIRESVEGIEGIKRGFCQRLQHIGIEVTPETADSFLLPINDEIVSMAAVIANIRRVTEQLQHLVESTRESPAHTKRYYGIYVLLVLAVERIQTHYIGQIDSLYLPKLRTSAQSAAQIGSQAHSEIASGGAREQLLGNIEANKKTIHACELMSEILQSHRQSILGENKKVKVLIGTAINSYRTVKLSFDVAELIGACDSAFRALRELSIPPLRTFKNIQLNEELQRLATQIAEKG